MTPGRHLARIAAPIVARAVLMGPGGADRRPRLLLTVATIRGRPTVAPRPSGGELEVAVIARGHHPRNDRSLLARCLPSFGSGGRGKKKNPLTTLSEGLPAKKTRTAVAEQAGLSEGTIAKARKIKTPVR